MKVVESALVAWTERDAGQGHTLSLSLLAKPTMQLAQLGGVGVPTKVWGCQS